MRRLRAIITGRVQGVGFRVFVESEARRLGLSGTVRNLYWPQRSVEVVAEGEEPDLQRLLDALQIGPSMARVHTVDVSWETASGQLSDFRII